MSCERSSRTAQILESSVEAAPVKHNRLQKLNFLWHWLCKCSLKALKKSAVHQTDYKLCQPPETNNTRWVLPFFFSFLHHSISLSFSEGLLPSATVTSYPCSGLINQTAIQVCDTGNKLSNVVQCWNRIFGPATKLMHSDVCVHSGMQRSFVSLSFSVSSTYIQRHTHTGRCVINPRTAVEIWCSQNLSWQIKDPLIRHTTHRCLIYNDVKREKKNETALTRNICQENNKQWMKWKQEIQNDGCCALVVTTFELH